MRENNLKDIIKNLTTTLNNNIFIQSLSDAKNNWLNISPPKIINNVIDYFKTLETINI